MKAHVPLRETPSSEGGILLSSVVLRPFDLPPGFPPTASKVISVSRALGYLILACDAGDGWHCFVILEEGVGGLASGRVVHAGEDYQASRLQVAAFGSLMVLWAEGEDGGYYNFGMLAVFDTERKRTALLHLDRCVEEVYMPQPATAASADLVFSLLLSADNQIDGTGAGWWKASLRWDTFFLSEAEFEGENVPATLVPLTPLNLSKLPPVG
jgi:hypothetical protein